jgi:hypothetical protein
MSAPAHARRLDLGAEGPASRGHGQSPRLDVARLVHRHLWSSAYPNPWRALGAQFTAYDRAVLLVRVFYVGAVFLTIQSMAEWPALLEVEAIASPWPSAWIPAGSVPDVIPWILTGYLVSAIVVASVPQWRPARILYFVMYGQFVSLISGFGGISHNNHTWLWVSGVLILLPNRGWTKRTRTEDRHYFLSVIWIAQILTMLFYALTGFWKIFFAFHGAVTARASSFAVDGFAQIVAHQQMRFNQDPVLAEFFVDNHVIGWAMFIGTMYVEVAAINAVFRPRLHRTWGILLIGFHVGTELAMGFTFLPNVLVAAILFVCSPFAPDAVSVREALLDLPGIYLVRRRWPRLARRRRADDGRAPVGAHN